MRALRNVIHIILVLAIVAGGLPVYHATDANQDEKTDLADAILRIRALASPAEKPDAFREQLREAFSALKAVSGFVKITNIPHKKFFSSQQMDSPYLIPRCGFFESFSFVEKVPIYISTYQSVTSSPSTPPPKC